MRHRSPVLQEVSLIAPVDQRAPGVVTLEDRLEERSSGRLGAKAANLARARDAGLPVMPGVVLPLEAAAAYREKSHPAHGRVVAQWLSAVERLSLSGGGAVVVRSSSPAEDTTEESRAGRYVSVVNVIGGEAVDRATLRVIDSGDGAMAVLAQPLVDAAVSGVLFGADPVSAEGNRLLVAVVNGLPEKLVSGRSSATHYHLSRRGRIVGVEQPDDAATAVLDRALRRRLARLAGALARLFGGPQDVEWAADRGGRLWLLQSRPITARAPQPGGPAILGTAGVDETFPDPLAPLEEDLWVPPLADGIRVVLEITRTVSRRTIAASPVAATVDGRVVVDQQLIGNVPIRRRWFDPRPGYRRLSAAWRVGRLRGALLPLTSRALARADRALLSLPEPERLADEVLLGALERAGEGLAAGHGLEMLVGMLLPATTAPSGPTGLGAAAGLLARLRAEEGSDPSPDADVGFLTDLDLIEEHPLLLALLPPRIGERAPLPLASPRRDGISSTADGRAAEIVLARESLRLRVRWLQEAQAVIVGELARRLHHNGVLADETHVRLLRLPELRVAVRTGWVPDDLSTRDRRWRHERPPLPERFHLSGEGVPIAIGLPPSDGPGVISGRGGGGGRGMGRVVHDTQQVVPGSVLVTATMDPRLAGIIPRLAGVIAETGSPLSHLAIVAREQGVPVVVGATGARAGLPAGTEVVLDGTTGEIRVVEQPAPSGNGREPHRLVDHASAKED